MGSVRTETTHDFRGERRKRDSRMAPARAENRVPNQGDAGWQLFMKSLGTLHEGICTSKLPLSMSFSSLACEPG